MERGVVGLPQTVQAPLAGAPGERAESRSIVMGGPVRPAVDMHMKIISIDTAFIYCRRIILGG